MTTDMPLLITVCLMATNQDLPTLTVESDDTAISQSCRVVVPAETVIADTNGDGVIQIGASDIVVEFATGSVLRGSPPGTRPDEYKGYGIRLNGHANVTVRNARISGYWCGLWATKADGVTLEDIDASDNRRAHLKSTPVAEDGSDWLSPHNNDNNEWLQHYAAAIYIEDSDNVTVRRCKVWHGQNGLCLDRVNHSKVYDNDFSFNSGWGIAMWRSNCNVISRNACDFCVRGYSHGVYNRGQDSAGILMFEQNCDNVIAENSATHGGDCFFGFAGREARGEIWLEKERQRLRRETGEQNVDKLVEVPPELAKQHRRRGNNNNLLINNDLSYAPAHGIEMTFSFGNKFIGNRMVENAICGVWAGYSQDTLIAGNYFEGNGEMAYGLERGGVNIEHGRGNRIIQNTFTKNKCGVHLWWDPDEHLAVGPWAEANGTESTDNLIAANGFVSDELAFHFRGPSEVTIGPNKIKGVSREIEAEPGSKVLKKPDLKVEPFNIPDYAICGESRPVGARKHLRGRHNIIMTEWGPWDHQSPLVRQVQATGDSVTYDLHKMPGKPRVQTHGRNVKGTLTPPKEKDGAPTYTVKATTSGVHPYVMRVQAGDFEKEIEGALLSATWDATFFKWTEEVDPREDLAGWRRLARGEKAVSAKAKQLTFKYAWGGPSEQNLSEELNAAKLGGDHFGMIAKTKLHLPTAKWEFTTMSDDGVRVTVDGEPIIENWTWHGPTRNTGTLEMSADKTVEIVVEHFEIDGYATLELSISPAD